MHVAGWRWRCVALAAVMLIAGSLWRPEAGGAQPRATRLVIGIGSLPNTPDPHLDSTANALPAYAAMFEKLVASDGKGGIVPVLAKSWRLVDPQTWEFELQQGVRFHNGVSLSAEDVKFTIERVLAPATRSPWLGRISAIDRVEVVDPTRIRIVTKAPFAPLLQGLTVVDIIPARYFQERGPAGFAAAPVGTGPFVFKEWVRADRMVFTANPGYWRGAPKVGEVVFRAIPEDSTRVAGLETGDLDVALLIPPEQVDRLKARGLEVRAVNLGQGMVVNLRSNAGGPLANRKVRQALNYAVDKDAIFKTLLRGFGRILDGQVVGPDAFGYNPTLRPYPYDPQRAKQLLAEAGFPQGFDLVFNGTIGRYTKDKEIDEFIVGQLAEVGVRARLEVVEGGVYIQRFIARQFEGAWIWAWQYFPAMDADLPLNFFGCQAVGNFFCSPAFDALFAQGRASTSPDKRAEILRRAARIVREEAPVIFLVQTPGIYGVQPRVRGLVWGADYLMNLHKVEVVAR
ncbi:MAG: ABC transporter substrate-binding protein [Armatimonadota bacterium]|nr:ABC transporter substrate-binding protein [Armatimonadota bacterium]MDR7452467.1 ABC transporter substrate-binding protein [Armatimonadota bacterium]MDR7467319.1 ABC transporter substrate-binding protein [Armatimonadota bacterium]MDR7494090.1 ABC transporter substrate-binding protein [Armatimonadota bacterium]MDR7498943.1 ABC transporter substrate-binding protein [Armatimonadota bacterium]